MGNNINIPNHLLFVIDSYICEKEKDEVFPKISRDFRELYSYKKKNKICDTCKIIRYKNESVCIHENINLYKAFKVLNKNYELLLKGKPIKTIHFENVGCLEYARPYLNDFGVICHFCCNGKGVTFFAPAVQFTCTDRSFLDKLSFIDEKIKNELDKKVLINKYKFYKYTDKPHVVLKFDENTGEFKTKIVKKIENKKKKNKKKKNKKKKKK